MQVRLAVTLAVACALAASLPVPAADAAPRPPTPELIDGALGRGEIDTPRANLLRAYAFGAPEKLPRAYRSATPWEGTSVLLRLRRDLRTMAPGPTRREIEAALAPAPSGTSCDSSSGSLPNSVSTSHFHVEYGTLAPGLSIAQYTASLETAWDIEIGSFGWAAPPVAPSPAPGGRYHVRIDALGTGLYGYVAPSGTHAGFVGDNPSTAWNEGDAYASCMVLNRDYNGFPSTPQNSLDATTAHEFNHSIQFGLGALGGPNVPDAVFTEGGATWMEDEVFDAANDSRHYLWPDLRDDMGDYDGSPYAYWITFRGLTERFGAGVAGGGEDVMQEFWERTSRNTASNLGAMEQALATKGATLPDAFHSYAIAAKFVKPCGGGYVHPHCFEEAAGFKSNAVAAANANAIGTAGGSVSGVRITDNYAMRFVGLPSSGGAYSVALSNTQAAGGPGRLRGSVVCDTGSALTVSPLPAVVADGQTQTLASFDPAGCAAPVLVVTNETKTSDNPSSSGERRFSVATAAIGTSPSTFALTVARGGTGTGTVTSSPAGIACGADCSESYDSGTSVTLTATPDAGSTFSGWSGGGCTGTATTCEVTMTQARSVTASFALVTHTLTTSRTGTGTGTVTSSPAGIDCGTDCSQPYASGTVVTLTATAGSGSTFSGWSGGGCTGTATTCEVTMTQARSVTASFTPQPPDEPQQPPPTTSTSTPSEAAPTPIAPPAALSQAPLASLADLDPPAVTIGRAALRRDTRGDVRLEISCPAAEPGGCRGTARLGRRGRTLARATFRVGGGRTVRVRMRLTSRTLRLLRTARRLRVTAVVVASDGAGNRATARRAVVLRA